MKKICYSLLISFCLITNSKGQRILAPAVVTCNRYYTPSYNGSSLSFQVMIVCSSGEVDFGWSPCIGCPVYL